MKDNLKLLISKEEIQRAVAAIATKIHRDYEGKSLVVIGVLKGSIIFLADLIRQIHLPTEVDFVKLSSYGSSKESSGTVRLLKDIDADIYDRDVLIVEEIIDSGRTLEFLYRRLQTSRPKSLKICALLDKKSKRVVNIEADYVGIEVEDKFLVGYGLDFNEAYRNLSDIYYLA
jgi:hypoxanthine phosphoribosyltransferase